MEIMSVDTELVGGLLERAARALPAVYEEYWHGWSLRYTDSSMWWSGAVLAHAPDHVFPLVEGVRSAERFYADLGAPARFQVCAACPAELDDVLAQRGYRVEGPMSIQAALAADVAGLPMTSSLSAQVAGDPDPAWFRVWQEVNGARSSHSAEWQLFERVPRPRVYVTVLEAERPISVGLAVADGGWTGVFGMGTLPAARHRSAARRVLAAVAGWALTQQCPRLYLQAEADNVAARRLYENAGFAEIAMYHYRLRPPL